MKLSGLDGVLELLQKLPAEVVSKKGGGPVARSLRKGAKVIHTAAKSNLEHAIAKGGDDSTGLLLQNLVVTRGKAPTGGNGERYLVRVRRKSYQRKGESVSTLKTAQIMEYGSEKQQATPWLRPAFQAQAQNAINTTVAELNKDLDRIVKKLSKR
jgi:HK97 gp10 family phage protein